MFDGNATEGRVVFQPGSCFFCPWGLSLGIIWWLGWWESRGRPALARVEQSRLQASLCRNVFRGTLEQASMEGTSFTFVCRKKYFLSRKKISTSISHLFQDAFTADYRQTNGRCLGRQTVWSDIAQWNHMVPPVTLIIHFCQLYNFSIFNSLKAMSMKLSMGHPPSFSVHKLSLKTVVSILHSQHVPIQAHFP